MLCLATTLLSVGCSRTVVLGSDCPEKLGPCDSGRFVEPDEDSRSDVDQPNGDQPDADELDADEASQPGDDAGTSAPHDASNDGSFVVENPSFELRENPAFSTIEGQFGADVLVSDLGGFVPVAGAIFANVDPWFACWVGTQVVKQLSTGDAGVFGSTDGAAMIETNVNGFVITPGLYQILDAPLQAGQSYSFEIDARGSSSSEVMLQLGATTGGCRALNASASTPVLSNTTWQTHCLTLTPSRELGVLALIPMRKNATEAGSVAFDNLRVVNSCSGR